MRVGAGGSMMIFPWLDLVGGLEGKNLVGLGAFWAGLGVFSLPITHIVSAPNKNHPSLILEISKKNVTGTGRLGRGGRQNQ